MTYTVKGYEAWQAGCVSGLPGPWRRPYYIHAPVGPAQRLRDTHPCEGTQMAIFQISWPEGTENAQNRTLRGLAATRLATPLLRFRRQSTPRPGSPNRNSQRWRIHARRWECWSVPQAFLPMMSQDPLVLSFVKQKRLRNACRTPPRGAKRRQPTAYSASLVHGGVHIMSVHLWDQHNGCATCIRARAPRWRFSKSRGLRAPKTLKIAHCEAWRERG